MLSLANVGVVLQRLNFMAKRLPLDAPWDAKHAGRLDGITLGGWLDRRSTAPFAKARAMLDAPMQLLYCMDPSEVSLLGALVLARGGKRASATTWIRR